MKNSRKVIAGVLSGVLLSSVLMVPIASANSNGNIQNELQFIENERISTEVLIEIIESEKENFNDPSYGDFLIEELEHKSNPEIETRGKFTTSAKLGAKALQKSMNKIGKKSWDAMVKKVEKDFGVSLVIFHWQSMTKLINILSNSSTTITDAVSNQLVKSGFNRTFADIIARTFVTIFF